MSKLIQKFVRKGFGVEKSKKIAAHYEAFFEQRKTQYPEHKSRVDVSSLRKFGIMHIPNFFQDHSQIEALKKALKIQRNIGDHLKIDNDYFCQVSHPMVVLKEVIPFAFDPRMADIAGAYFKCAPAVTNANLRISKATTKPCIGNLLFHMDPNGPRFLKMFIYMNDVDMDRGPFTYVKGSHKKVHPDLSVKSELTMEQLLHYYCEQDIVYATGKVGDLVIADTSGFHRGTKVRKGERFMLTLNYSFHPEKFASPPYTGRISPQFYNNLPPSKKYLADFLNITTDTSDIRSDY